LRFDLTDLRLFLLTVETGSITKGAQAAHLALASASERISGMEAVLGVALLERDRRGVRPTAAGATLVQHARLILDQVEQMRGDLRHFSLGLKGRIRVLANTAALAAFLPDILSRFLAAHPDLDIDLEERPSHEIVLAVADGLADFGIVADVVDLGVLHTYPVMQDQLALVVSASHRLARRDSVAFADLLGEPFVGLSDAALEQHLAAHASRLGRRLHYRIRLRSIDAIVRLVAADVGLAILSHAVVAGFRVPSVAVVPLADGWANRKLTLCVRDLERLTPHARLLAGRILADADPG
jgi:DNA-binding transcriptional LysR family regulator